MMELYAKEKWLVIDQQQLNKIKAEKGDKEKNERTRIKERTR